MTVCLYDCCRQHKVFKSVQLFIFDDMHCLIGDALVQKCVLAFGMKLPPFPSSPWASRSWSCLETRA
jgi:hypothetical protein